MQHRITLAARFVVGEMPRTGLYAARMSAAAAPRGPRFSRRSLRFELLTLVAVLVGIYLGAGVVVGQDAVRQDRRSAITTTRFAAGLAAASVATSIADIERFVSRTAAGDERRVTASSCPLPRRDAGAFAVAHVDLLLPSGPRVCSSLARNAPPGGATYAGQPWLREVVATRGPVVSAPFTDPHTGQRSIAIASPILAGDTVTGVLVDIVGLDGVGAYLKTNFGGGARVDITMVDTVSGTIMTTSENRARIGSRADASGIGETPLRSRAGLDGVRRIYGSRGVDGRPWTVLAGWVESDALALARSALRNQVLLSLTALVLGTVGVLMVDRRIARPVRALKHAVDRAGASLQLDPVVPSGPAELADLTEGFNDMLAARATYESGLRDLNEELEERVTERTAQLQRSNTELDRFASLAAHDLQEPLRTITGFADLLAERVATDPDSIHLVARITARAERMRQLINDLLAYARAGTAEPVLAPTDVAEAVAEAIEELRAVIEATHAVVTVDAPLPRVIADIEDLAQVFQNLIANALKFHRPDTIPTVRVSAERQGPVWVLSVTDDGIGIDPRYAERIFEPFRRLHPKEEYPGTGMGLGICAKLAEKMGGKIWVESAPGAGATFRFTIPAA